jgi:hypothetical protein
LKKSITGVFILLIAFLAVTKSLYVQFDEFFFIVVTLTVVSIIYNYYVNRADTARLLLSSAFIGFFLCWLFCVIDIMIDHFTLPKGKEDGVPLTIGFKIDEFSDDLFLANVISMFIVVIITFLANQILSKITRKEAR